MSVETRTHVQVPEDLALILLSYRQCSRCETAVRCGCVRTPVCVISHMVASYTPNPPHALTSPVSVQTLARTRTHTRTRALTLSPKQLQCLENTRSVHAAKGKSNRFLALNSTNGAAEPECNQQLSQSGTEGAAANGNRRRGMKQLEIEINQSEGED